jgi:hypothetical protein
VHGVVVRRVEVLAVRRDRDVDGVLAAGVADDAEVRLDLVRALGAPRHVVPSEKRERRLCAAVRALCSEPFETPDSHVAERVDVDDVDKRRRHEQVLDDRREHVPRLKLRTSVSEHSSAMPNPLQPEPTLPDPLTNSRLAISQMPYVAASDTTMLTKIWLRSSDSAPSAELLASMMLRTAR